MHAGSVGNGSCPAKVVGSTPDLWIERAEMCLCSSGNPKRTPVFYTHRHTSDMQQQEKHGLHTAGHLWDFFQSIVT